MSGLTIGQMNQVAEFGYRLIADSEERVAQAIGAALHQFGSQLDRPLSLQYGTVVDANPSVQPVDVQLDADGGVVSSYAVGTVARSDRVALVFIPPAGQLILGTIGASTGGGGGGGGTQGPAGPPGPAGPAGNSVLNGTGAPSNTVGNDGDFYIDTAAENIYGPKTAGAWGAATSLVGPAGSGGGSTNTVLHGTADPTSGVGNNGDFFINTTTETIFGAKTAGAWGAGTALKGPAGPVGPVGPAGSGGTEVLLDSFAGATDDVKLTNALSFAAAATYTPVIKLSSRLYTFTQKQRVPFDGMTIVGPGDGKYSTASGPNSNRSVQINLNFDSSVDGIGWFHSPQSVPNTSPPVPQPQVKAVSFIDLAFVDGGGTGHASFLTQDPQNGNGFQQLLVRNITTNGLWSVIGSPPMRLLLTACIFDGNWDLNNGWHTAVYVGGSDNSFWDGGQMLMDSPGAGDGVPHEPAGNGVPHIRFGFLDKTVVGRIYCTCDGKWYAMLVEGQTYNSGAQGGNGGPLVIRGLIAEGRKYNNPCYGHVVRVTGGQPIFDSPWFGYGMTNPALQGLGAGGMVHVTGGYVRIHNPTYGQATGVTTDGATAVPMLWASGQATQVRLRDGAVGSQGGVWGTPKPRTHAAVASGQTVAATVDIDNSFIAV